MPWIPWKVRMSCYALVLVAGGSFAGASGVTGPGEPTTPVAIRQTPPPTVEPSHHEPGDDELHPVPLQARDVTGRRFPPGLTIYGGARRRTILFTFDDGPSRATTPALLDVLDEEGITAVFFVKSESFGRRNPWERQHAEIVREIARRGHVIGNHTETHRQLPLLRNEEIAAELGLSERKIARTVGRRPRLIRPPGGALSKRVEQLLGESGYTSVMWAVYGGDLEARSPEDVVQTFFRVLDRRERDTGDRGGIVLLHDTKRHSVEAVPRLVAALRARNCRLLDQGEELYDIVDDLGYFIPGYEPDQSLDERQEALRVQTERICHTLASR